MQQTHAITNFLHSSYLDSLPKTSEKGLDNAHSCVIKFMKANEKEMWNSVEVRDIYSENGGYKLNS